jgi:hypothetical protein
MIKTLLAISFIAISTGLAGCKTDLSYNQKVACANGLSQAGHELEQAKVNGFSGTVAWTKAASLLAAAKIQQQFEKYPNCIDKVKRARVFIRDATQL